MLQQLVEHLHGGIQKPHPGTVSFLKLGPDLSLFVGVIRLTLVWVHDKQPSCVRFAKTIVHGVIRNVRGQGYSREQIGIDAHEVLSLNAGVHECAVAASGVRA